jgi:flavin prenyltransferase
MISQPGQVVISREAGIKLPGRPAEIQRFLTEHYHAKSGQLKVFGRKQWAAPVTSGSGAPDALVICPCTAGTLAAVAGGVSRSLLERAADVALKERKKLILVIRETPLSEIHLENMLKLARMGTIIMPAHPGFYYRPQWIDDLIDFIVARVLDHLEIEHQLLPRWGFNSGAEG